MKETTQPDSNNSPDNTPDGIENKARNNKTMIIVIIIAVFFLCVCPLSAFALYFIGAIAEVGNALEEHDTATNVVIDEPDIEPLIEPELIEEEDIVFTKENVRIIQSIDPFIPTDPSLQPLDGFKFIAIEVQYENDTNDSTLTYSPSDWMLLDEDGFLHEQSYSVSKEPILYSGSLYPGEKVDGWVVFEIEEGLVIDSVEFRPE